MAKGLLLGVRCCAWLRGCCGCPRIQQPMLVEASRAGGHVLGRRGTLSIGISGFGGENHGLKAGGVGLLGENSGLRAQGLGFRGRD